MKRVTAVPINTSELLVLIHQNWESRFEFWVNGFALKPCFNLRIILSEASRPLPSEAGCLLPTQRCPISHGLRSSPLLWKAWRTCLVPSRGTVHLPNQHGHRGNRPGLCHTVDGLIKNLGGCSGHQQSQLFQLWFILVLGHAYEPGSIGRT